MYKSTKKKHAEGKHHAVKKALAMRRQSVNHYLGAASWMIPLILILIARHTKESHVLRTSGRIPGKNAPRLGVFPGRWTKLFRGI